MSFVDLSIKKPSNLFGYFIFTMDELLNGNGPRSGSHPLNGRPTTHNLPNGVKELAMSNRNLALVANEMGRVRLDKFDDG